MLNNSDINKGLLKYLLKLNLHSNINDLYATCIVANTLMKVDEFKLCSAKKRELLTNRTYNAGDYTLFKEVIEQKDDFDTRFGECNSIELNPLHILWMLPYTVGCSERIHISRKKKEIRLIKYNGEIYETIQECIKETGMSKYHIQKMAVKEIIEGIVSKNAYQGKIDKYPIIIECDYRDDVVKDFHEKTMKDTQLWLRLYKLDPQGMRCIVDFATGFYTKNLEYFRIDSGRYFVKADPSIQGMKSIYRHLFFDEYYEVDLNTAAPSTLLQMDNEEYPVIKDYISNKDKYRTRLVEHGLSKEDSKKFITSMFFGSEPMNPRSQFWEKKSREVIPHLIEDDMIYPLMEEVYILFKRLGKLFKEKAIRDKGKWIVTNENNRTKTFDRWNSKQVISFMYQGIESRMLEIMMENCESVLLLHDAIITKSLPNIPNLISLIKEKTGYNVTFSYKKYNKEVFFKEIGYVES